MNIKILNRWSGSIIFECEAESIKLAIKLAIESKVSLSNADLSGAKLIDANLSWANLSRADLRGADLRGADLSGADLSNADLIDADLSRADLRGADLIDANLSNADLRGADLSGADLSNADLIDANLSNADLRGADLIDAELSRADLIDAELSRADLSVIRYDFFKILSSASNEVAALRNAIVNGKINGSTYSGECACLVGTIANARKCDYKSLVDLTPNASRPAERFFLGIKEGDTPENSPISKIVLGWVDEWLNNMRNAFGNGAMK